MMFHCTYLKHCPRSGPWCTELSEELTASGLAKVFMNPESDVLQR